MKPPSHLLCAHFISYLSGTHTHCGQDVRQASGNCRRGAMSSGVPRQLHVPAEVFFTPLVNTFYLLLQGWFACAPSASHSLVKRSLKCLFVVPLPFFSWGFPGSSVAKNPPTLETCVQSLGQEDPLAEEMATCFSILAWKIPWTEEPRRLHSL